MSGRTSGHLLHDSAGVAVLSYELATFNGVPWADHAVPLAPHAAREVLDRLGGWRVSGDPGFAEELLGLGALPDRHAHSMLRDLRADPPPPDWAWGAGQVQIVAGRDRPMDEIWALHQQAFGPDHPDRRHIRESDQQRRARFAELLGGAVFGPSRPGTACALAAERLVGLVAVFNLVDAAGPVPWICSVFRSPDAQWRGLGGILVRHAVAAVHAAGWDRIGLAVTVGNPALELYLRLGFLVTDTAISVRIPGEPAEGRPEIPDRPSG